MSDDKISELPWCTSGDNEFVFASDSAGKYCGDNPLVLKAFDFGDVDWRNNRDFIIKACNSYHDNQKLIAEQKKKIGELEEFVSSVTPGHGIALHEKAKQLLKVSRKYEATLKGIIE